jgi:dTDP-glucose 4,6-dehydratase
VTVYIKLTVYKNKMNILITGAGGYIGKNLVEHLTKTNNVTSLTRTEHDIRIPFPDDDKHYDVCIHLAGNPSAKSCIENPGSAVYDNIVGTYNVLEYARKKCIKRFLYFSTCEVYNGNLDAKETDLPSCTNMYAASKLSGEHMCEAYLKSYDFMKTCIVFRLIHSYGKYCQDDRFASQVIKKFKTEECPHFILKTKTPKRWISTDDICKITEHFIKREDDGFNVYNLVGSENLTLEQFIKKLSNEKSFTVEYDITAGQDGYVYESNANRDKLKNFIDNKLE